MKKAVEDGVFGRVTLCDAYLKYYRDQAYYDSGDWRGTWELDGGGALMNQGIHGVDLIDWMTGGLNCTYTDNLHAYQIEDMSRAILDNRDPMVTGEQALHSVGLILAIYESARIGKEVFIED